MNQLPPEFPAPIKVLHVITGLGAGGAERQLATLALRSDPSRVRHEVVSLLDEGMWGTTLRQAGVTVHALRLTRKAPAPFALPRLARLYRRSGADIVQTWLYHADLAGILAAGLAGGPPVVWSLRCSRLDFRVYGMRTRLLVGLLAMLSRYPAAVVANAAEGRRWHVSLGYRPRRWEVIHNGIDCAEFRPDPEARRAVRSELDLAPDATLIGNLSRHDPMKDHPTLLAALARLNPNVRLLLAGGGTGAENASLSAQIAAAGIDPARVLRLGLRRDVPRLLAALDIAVLSSAFGEGFPNIVAEAMACGVPCAATAIGDTQELIDGCGEVAVPRDPAALGAAIARLLALDLAARTALGARARERIETRFSVDAMVSAHAHLYDEIVTGRRKSRDVI